MNCPSCGHSSSSVVDSRPQPSGEVRRRRVCDECEFKWSSMEITVATHEKFRSAMSALFEIEGLVNKAMEGRR